MTQETVFACEQRFEALVGPREIFDSPVRRLQLWKDLDGHARICGVVLVERVLYAVLLRTRGAGGRKRRPFLFPVESLMRGDDGWQLVEDANFPERSERQESDH